MWKAGTTGKPISFLILDIDYFKSVNDTHGHDIGDEVLREFANRISANVRGIDLACRHGGEEFVVVMPDTDLGFAFIVAERLRQRLPTRRSRSACARATRGDHLDRRNGERSAGDTADALLRRADQALYRAKREGRNRVIAEAA